ncbi:MAG: hypothetical protein UX82_C0006G0001, partial [Microgenomates group bacterium GW2011_GWE1_47_12]
MIINKLAKREYAITDTYVAGGGLTFFAGF